MSLSPPATPKQTNSSLHQGKDKTVGEEAATKSNGSAELNVDVDGACVSNKASVKEIVDFFDGEAKAKAMTRKTKTTHSYFAELEIENQICSGCNASLETFTDIALKGQIAQLNGRVTFLNKIYDAISDAIRLPQSNRHRLNEALQSIDVERRRFYRTEALLRSYMDDKDRA